MSTRSMPAMLTLLSRRTSGQVEIKRRDGAIYWNLFRDTADKSRFVETFIVDSWAEQSANMDGSQKLIEKLRNGPRLFHRGASLPKICTSLPNHEAVTGPLICRTACVSGRITRYPRDGSCRRTHSAAVP